MKLAGEAKMREEPVVRRTFPKKPSGSVVISASPFRGEHTHKAHAKGRYFTLLKKATLKENRENNKMQRIAKKTKMREKKKEKKRQKRQSQEALNEVEDLCEGDSDDVEIPEKEMFANEEDQVSSDQEGQSEVKIEVINEEEEEDPIPAQHTSSSTRGLAVNRKGNHKKEEVVDEEDDKDDSNLHVRDIDNEKEKKEARWMENSDSLMESNKWEEEEEDDGEDSDEGEEQDGDNQRLTNSSAERDKLRKELASLPLSRVREIKDKLGIKLFNETYFGEEANEKRKESEGRSLDGRGALRRFKRENPRRPREESSKKPVSRFRPVYPNESQKKKKFDPRFDERCGAFNEHIYENNYDFLHEIRKNEVKDLKKELMNAKKAGDLRRIEELKNLIRKEENRRKTREEKERVKETMKELKQENIQRMRQGFKPIFYTRASVKMKIMEKKFDQLKKEKGLEKYMKRKAKKASQLGGATVPVGEAEKRTSTL